MRRRFLAAAVFLFQACQLFSTYLSFFRLFPVKRIPANPARETAIRANHRSSRVSSPVLGDASGGVGVWLVPEVAGAFVSVSDSVSAGFSVSGVTASVSVS